MDHDRKQTLRARLAKCRDLARQFTDDSVTSKNLRELADELEHELRELESR